MIKIGKRKIGYNFKPLIICELGINHGGSLLVAKKMVNLAKRNGAEAIKNQNHILNEEMINEDDFEFNQDFEIEENTRSPGWIRYQKRIK